MIKYVYIASPYTHGDQVVNVRRSLEAAEKLLVCGFIPFCPLLCHLWHLTDPKPYEYWIRLNLAWVTKCDAVLRLAGDSMGADMEVTAARAVGLPVFLSIEGLIEQHGVEGSV